MKQITANDILKLLHKKHGVEKYLCVDECKVGSTWFTHNCSRLDLWVMARSWAHPRFIGYEIKVNRQDFLGDVKWPDYLHYCTELYFVAPPGIIDASEVPEQAGLLVSSKNCKRLYTKKKAPVRNVEIPNSILIYILMSRTKIVGDMFLTRPNIEIWKEHLKQLKENKKVGYAISYHISNKVDKEVKEIKQRNRKLEDENNKLIAIKKALEEMGVDMEHIVSGYSNFVKKDRLNEILTGIPYDLVQFLKSAEANLARANSLLEKAQNISH